MRGPGVTYGYWADPEKTQKMVVPNHFQEHFEEKMYRTGDIVTVGDDGNYYFQGRRDSQIKSRGYRIELGEIEARCSAIPECEKPPCWRFPTKSSATAFELWSRRTFRDRSEFWNCSSTARHACPKYMIPELVDLFDELPKTSTGKIDRVKLASEVGCSCEVKATSFCC